MSDGPRRLAVLVSGSGRSLDNLIARSSELGIEIGLVLSDREGVRALEIAERHGLPSVVVAPRRYADAAAAGAAIWSAIRAARVELVVLAGFLRLLPVPADWRGRVLNIHPSLLPKYGGKGFFGNRVHAAVLAAGDATSGCTVHYVDEQYDTGPPLLQRTVSVEPRDTTDALAARVFAAEKEALPEAIQLHFARTQVAP